jgi:hypothetical protein
MYHPKVESAVGAWSPAADSQPLRFWPEGRHLISWGPNGLPNPLWNYQGRRLDMYHNYSPRREMTGLGGTQ